MQIGDVKLGSRTLVVAEVGSNHLGCMELARESVYAAAECGADAVKFQMYTPEKLVEPRAPVLRYIGQTHATQQERFRSLQLPRSAFVELCELAKKLGLGYLVTPFDETAVDFLDPLVPAFKVASGDLTNLRLLRHIAKKGKPLLLSTGCARVDEIDWAVAQLPKEDLVLLHCIGAYPTPDDEVNLSAIPFLRDRYGVSIGFSDHSRGTVAAVAAVALGAQVVEKHFILSKHIPAADTKLSIDPDQLKEMVEAIRRVERMRGEPGRSVTPSEEYFRRSLRRSVYAAKAIGEGCVITEDMLVVLRPHVEGAVRPEDLFDLLGKRTLRPIAEEGPIMTKDVE